ncbi:MAG: AAA family ATPase, partial [Microbacterium sp.]
MRIHRIEIEGFGPFRAAQVVDLDDYADDGIFLITGRTGAGKSSILDAICFALYGTTPRYEEGEKRLRSDHAGPDDATRVALEFTAGGTRWRIERSPDYPRPKKRGDGTTLQKATAEMSAWDGAQWVGRAARPVDVGHLVDEIVGLSRQQFLQVILLAQGRFARFLLARNDERQRLLRSLFDTKRFEDYEQELAERSRAARERIDDGERDLVARLEHAEGLGAEARSDEPSGGETDEGSGDRVDGGVADEARDDAVDPASLTLARRIARVRRAAERARVVADARSEAEREAAGRREAARRAHDERAARRDRQVRRDATRDRLTALRAREDEIAQLRGEGEAATRAEGVRGAVAERARAERARAEAASQRERALAAWEEVGDGQADAPDDLDAFAAGAQNRVGAWEERRRTEEGLADAERSLE